MKKLVGIGNGIAPWLGRLVAGLCMSTLVVIIDIK
jgi:hypothetical protein